MDVKKTDTADSTSQKGLCFFGCLLAGLLPFLWKYCIAMWNQELYQFFPFLLISIGYLTYHRMRGGPRLPSGACAWSLIILGIFTLIPAALLRSSWLGAVAFVIWTTAFLASQRGLDGRSIGYLSLPLLMFVRSPMLATYAVMHRLQKLTTSLSSTLLDVLGVVHERGGNTIELTSKSLFVAEACSGVQSLFTMCFVSFLLMVYRRRSMLAFPVYVFFAIFFAVVGNVIRVTSIAVAEAYFRVDLANGIQHDVTGYVALSIAIGLLVCFDHLVDFIPLLRGRHAGTANEELLPAIGQEFKQQSFDPLTTDWLGTFRSLRKREQSIAIVAFMCGALMLFEFFTQESKELPVVATNEVLFDPSPALPSQVASEVQVFGYQVNRDKHGDRNSRFGMNSDIYQCGIEKTRGQFVVSQPYLGWHELPVCYGGKGWNLKSRTPMATSQGNEPIVVAEFTRGSTEFGTLFFAAVDSDGSFPRTLGHSRVLRMFAPLEPLIMDDFAELSGSAQTIMLQYWVVGQNPLTLVEKNLIAEKMGRLREGTSKRVAEQTRQRMVRIEKE